MGINANNSDVQREVECLVEQVQSKVLRCQTNCVRRLIRNRVESFTPEEIIAPDDFPAGQYMALEWWSITAWLGEELREIGEILVIDDLGYWWGARDTRPGHFDRQALRRVAMKYIHKPEDIGKLPRCEEILDGDSAGVLHRDLLS